jgi:uncharacterized alpha-E superfamily protein
MEPVVDLLLLDELNPRAVGFQTTALGGDTVLEAQGP